MKTTGLILSIILIFCGSCQKDNLPPEIEITIPRNGATFIRGEKVTILADARDPDGIITEVRFYVNDIGLSSSIGFPYVFEWYSTNANPGTQKIKVIAADDKNLENEATVEILLKINLPVVLTYPVFNITSSTAICKGEVTCESGSEVYERGICWAETPQPTIINHRKSAGTGIGKFEVRLESLRPGTACYARAYATNSAGTTYGDQVSFTTLIISGGTGKLTDTRDGHEYSIAKIGRQWWMAENLAYLPSVSPHENIHDDLPHFYVYEYNGIDVNEAKTTGNYKTYGVLYNWYAAMQGAGCSNANPSGVKGICPDGWHLPGDAEWQELEISMGMTQLQVDSIGFRGSNQGAQLKSTIYWYQNDSNMNSVGFSAFPGGMLDDCGLGFHYLTYYGYWWSATQYNVYYAWYRRLDYSLPKVLRYYARKDYAHSVRCVKD